MLIWTSNKYKCCLNILSHAWLSTFEYHLSWILVSLQDAYHEPNCVFWDYTNAYVWFSFCSSQEIHHKEQSRFNTRHREDAKFVFEGCVFLCLFYYCLSFFFEDEKRNFVSLICNQTIYYKKNKNKNKKKAISYRMCSYINVDL